MGERLLIEIIKDDRLLANAYYHWGGYTSSSFEITNTIINNIDRIDASNDVLYAVRLLETTGALLKETEIEEMEAFAKGEKFDPAANRNDGLIAVSDEGKDDLGFWADALVEIDLDKKIVKLDVFEELDKEDFFESFRNAKEQYEKLPVAKETDYKIIPFDKFNAVAEEIFKMLDNHIYGIRLENGDVLQLYEPSYEQDNSLDKSENKSIFNKILRILQRKGK